MQEPKEEAPILQPASEDFTRLQESVPVTVPVSVPVSVPVISPANPEITPDYSTTEVVAAETETWNPEPEAGWGTTADPNTGTESGGW